ncbi:hypothetical protein CapIbe_014439 [Capra ibex]
MDPDSRGGSQAWKKTGRGTTPLSTKAVLPTPRGSSETCLTLIPAEIWLLPLAQAVECSVVVWLVFLQVTSLDGDLEVIFSDSSTILILLQKMESTKITVDGD